MDGGKKEDGYLVGISPRNTTPPRTTTLAQLAEERLGSLQYLLQSKNGVTSSPPSRNRPRASTATSTGGTGRAASRVRRSTSGNVEEAAADASVARSRGLFSSAPGVASSRERPRSQGSSSSGRRQASGSGGKGNGGSSTYRLSIDNNLERAPMGSNHVVGGISPSASAWRHRPQPPPSSSSGSTPERGVAEAAGLAAPRQGRGRVATGLSATATTGGSPARKLSGSSIYGGSDHSRGSYGGVGILGKGGGEDNDSFFGYSDDDDGGHDDEASDDAEDSFNRRRRLLNSCWITAGLSWAAVLMLCVSEGAGTPSPATAFGAAVAGYLLVIAILAMLARLYILLRWRPREEEEQEEDDGDRETSLCCLRVRGRKVDEGGRLAEIGGVTYLAI